MLHMNQFTVHILALDVKLHACCADSCKVESQQGRAVQCRAVRLICIHSGPEAGWLKPAWQQEACRVMRGGACELAQGDGYIKLVHCR